MEVVAAVAEFVAACGEGDAEAGFVGGFVFGKADVFVDAKHIEVAFGVVDAGVEFFDVFD